jgi:WD40 repeat protein
MAPSNSRKPHKIKVLIQFFGVLALFFTALSLILCYDGQTAYPPKLSNIVLSGTSFYGLSFSSDSKIVAYGYNEHINIYNLESRNLLSSIYFSSRFEISAFSRDNKYLAVSAQDNYIRIFCLDSESEVYTLSNPSKIHSLQFSHYNTRLASWSYDKRIRVWSLDNRELIGDILMEDANIGSLAFSSNDNQFAIAFRHGLLYCFDLDTFAVNFRFKLDNIPRMLKFSGKDHSLISISEQGTLTRINILGFSSASSKTEIYDVISYPLIQISEDANYVVLAGSKTSVWNEMLSDIKYWDNDEELACIAISNGGKQVVTADKHRHILIWDVESVKSIWEMKAENNIESLQFSPDEKYILVQGDNGWVSIYIRI